MVLLVFCLSLLCLLSAGLLWVLGGRKKTEAQEQGGPRPPVPAGNKESGLPALSPALYLDLAATMLTAGLSVPAVLEQLSQLEQGRYRTELAAVVAKLYAGAHWEQAWGKSRPEGLAPVRDCLGMALETGAPSAQLVRVLADRQRRHRQRQHEKSAARLAVKLVVPLGACSLPAFICLGVIPVLIALLPTLF
ncbi:type II secretion system F family protein [Rothia sp. CCM 9416]|uniref:type II secretion system F family protein n=1 Tax=Rothia sp. CCM 9416 TaxID=3402655 RepID=UPI003AEC3357